MSLFPLPTPLLKFFAIFPLYSYPSIYPPSKRPLKAPTLWIAPPRTDSDADVLSSDIDCLKWQAYMALKGMTGIALQWDIAPEGAIDCKLPNLHVSLEGKIQDADEGELLPASMIPTWIADRLGDNGTQRNDALDGYKDQEAKDESLAWTSLLESHIRAALLLAQPSPPYLKSLLNLGDSDSCSLDTLMNPPPPPLTGFSPLLRPMGTRINTPAIESRYREAIASLAERLGTDKWFLGSESATALDALVFAYLHTILHSADPIRVEATRRVNLVAWEWRVRSIIRAAFHKAM